MVLGALAGRTGIQAVQDPGPTRSPAQIRRRQRPGMALREALHVALTEVINVIRPPDGLARMIRDWPQIPRALAEPPRKRLNQLAVRSEYKNKLARMGATPPFSVKSAARSGPGCSGPGSASGVAPSPHSATIHPCGKASNPSSTGRRVLRARLTRRVREEYRVYLDRDATQSAATRQFSRWGGGSAGCIARSNAGWVWPVFLILRATVAFVRPP